MSETTAMIDVTATMLPRTVMKDRSLADQIASSAIMADSQYLFMACGNRGEIAWQAFSYARGAPPPLARARRRGPQALPALLLLRVYLHEISVLHPSNGVVRSGDDLVARPKAGEHLEVLVARDAHLDRHELGTAAPDDEHAFGFLARLPGFELGGGRNGLDAALR